MQRLLLQVNAFGEQVAPGEGVHKGGSDINPVAPVSYLLNTDVFKTFTCVSAIGLIGLVHTINDAVAAVGVGSAASFVTLKSVSGTVCKWRNRVILDTVPRVVLKFHAVRAATHSFGGWDRETEVAAVSVGRPVALAAEHCERENKAQLASAFVLSGDSMLDRALPVFNLQLWRSDL